MKKLLYALTITAALVSCAESYNIQGSSSLALLDGNKLYLKVMHGDELKDLDSCEVVHGKFRFAGLLDTTQMAALYMDERSVMPVVVEKGDINIRIDETQQKVSGSPLNEVLYDFLGKHKRLGNLMEELDHRYSQMLLDGIEEEQIVQELTAEASTINQQEDSLVTDFVVSNFDNVLGPFIFVQMSSSVPQVEHIMSKAPEEFKQLPEVSEFYKNVTSNANPALEPNAPVDTNPQDIDDATIQDILNGKQ